MRIDSCFKYPNMLPVSKVSDFKGLWTDEYDGYFGDDGDPYGSSARDIMRERLYANVGIPSVSEKTLKSNPLAFTLNDVHIQNFRVLGNSSYSGECLMHHPDYLKLLIPSGVIRVIDLRDKKGLKEACEENNVEYYSYSTAWGYGGQSIFKKDKDLIKEETDKLAKLGLTKKEFDENIERYKSQIQDERTEYVRKLAKLIDVVNEGHFYMSCEYGEYRTVNCLALVSAFNPDWRGAKIAPNSEYVDKIKNMYENLTPEHKKILKIDENYDEYLKNYIANLSGNN